MDFKKLYKSELRRLFLRCEEECLYYVKENDTCQSKKCATGGDGTVTLLDRIFCEPRRREEDERTD